MAVVTILEKIRKTNKLNPAKIYQKTNSPAGKVYKDHKTPLSYFYAKRIRAIEKEKEKLELEKQELQKQKEIGQEEIESMLRIAESISRIRKSIEKLKNK